MGLAFLKLQNSFPFKFKYERILMFGHDAAGKTTILHTLKLNKTKATILTVGFNVETLTTCKGVKFTAWDDGGQVKLRALSRHYYQNTTGSMTPAEVANGSELTKLQNRKWYVQGCCAITGGGLQQAVQELVDMIKETRN